MAPPILVRPGPVQVESAASQPLHNLLSELLTAKSNWEQLAIQVALGYTNAFDTHEKTLQEMKKAAERDAFSAKLTMDALMFVLSVTSVGLAGGVVGGLIAPWIRNAGQEVAMAVYRQGVSGVAQQAAKQMVNAGATKVDKIVSGSSGNGGFDPYKVTAPKEILVDQRLRARIGSAFGPILEAVNTMIAMANSSQSDAKAGQEILNNFRQSCPLLTDAPLQANIPSDDDAERAAELAMWVAWANERDWSWWNEKYKWLDPRLWETVRRTGSESDFNQLTTQYSVSKKYALEMDPLGRRMLDLGKWGAVSTRAEPYFGQMYGSFTYTDLRKVRDLPLDDADLPFGKLTGLNMQWDKTKPLERVNFLSKQQNVRPAFKP